MTTGITRVDTRTGDEGTTALVGGKRVPKDWPRIAATARTGGTSVENTPGEVRRVENREVHISWAGRHKSVSTDKCPLADRDLLIHTLWAACACETWWRGGVR